MLDKGHQEVHHINVPKRYVSVIQGVYMEQLTKPHRKEQYNLRIDPDLLAWLREQAVKHERPVNYIINHAIKQFKKHQEL